MGIKKNPLSLYNIALQQVTKALLEQWRNTYYTNYAAYSEELKGSIGVTIPYTIYDQIFDIMIDSHARVIQNDKTSENIPSISSLIESAITPNLRKLNLNCLRHMGIVKDEEIRYLETILLNELPNLRNLVEILLQTSGTDSTLPICNDEIMDKIGNSCPNLKTLDVSYNHTVTDTGLSSLTPVDSQGGCPLLTKLFVFECSVTAEGIAMLLEKLPHLKFLGYRETGQALIVYSRHKRTYSSIQALKLCHVNNLGIFSRTCKDVYKLKCEDKLINAIYTCCPNLSGLKIRVTDLEMQCLHKLSSVSILELVYNVGTPSSPGSNTIQYLQLCGTQLVSLSFVCELFTTQYLKVICEQCNNLKRLWIRSNQFYCEREFTNADKKKNCLLNLEVFFFRVGSKEVELCHIPLYVFKYVLHKSNSLIEIVLAMKNSLICDRYIQDLFASIQTSKLKHVMILVPHKNLTLSLLNLSMLTVEALINMCPKLEQLGNLLVWDVSLEEIQELRRQLRLTNSALVLLYRMMYS